MGCVKQKGALEPMHNVQIQIILRMCSFILTFAIQSYIL